MPIERTPGRRLTTGIQGLTSDHRAREMGKGTLQDGITFETIEAVLANGTYRIGGAVNRELHTTGSPYGLLAGMQVAVAWRNGEPTVILSHTARRAQFTRPLVAVGLGIVEEWFLQDEEGVVTFLFRNFDQFTSVEFLNDDGTAGNSPQDVGLTEIVAIQWGKGDANFFVIRGRNASSENIWLVYALQRPQANEPFPRGAKIRAKLVKLYNMTTLPHTFGTISITDTVNIASGVLKYFGAQYSAPAGDLDILVEGITTLAGVAPNGDLLVTLQVRGSADATNRTAAVYELGMLLINVTRDGLILQNRLASGIGPVTSFVSPNSTPVCIPVASSSISASLGGAVATAGSITVLSLTGQNPDNPADPDEPGTFNNYLLVAPATVFAEAVRVENPPGTPIGEIFCSPTRATLKFSIVGEFADDNIDFAEFPGSPLGPAASQVPRFQGSRTLVQYVPEAQNIVGGFIPPLKIRDLRRAVTSNVEGNPSGVFGIAPAGQPNANNPLLFMTQASLMYSPFDATPPFNHQFFVSGHNRTTGEVTVDLGDLQKLASLAIQAKLAAARGNTVQFAVIGTTEIQVIDSRPQLKGFFQPGPL